jgi:plasmid stability protein
MTVATLTINELPLDLYACLVARAKRNHRSVEEELVRILDETLRGDERSSLLDLQGLGKTEWNGGDAAAHVDAERRGWD